MNEQLFQVSSEVSKVTTMGRRSCRIVVDTQEGLTDEQMGKLMSLHEKVGWFTFSVEPVKTEDILNLPELTYEKDEKSPAQVMRGVLFRYWEQKKQEQYKTFAEFYAIEMERITNVFREKLT